MNHNPFEECLVSSCAPTLAGIKAGNLFSYATAAQQVNALLEAGLSGKVIALFGSYGWGDGQWMRDWEERCASLGAKVFRREGLIVNGEPDAAAIDACKAFGNEFAES